MREVANFAVYCIFVIVLTCKQILNFSLYINIGKAERTREFVLEGLQSVQTAFKDHDLVANIRLETYEGERYFHVPPTEEST